MANPVWIQQKDTVTSGSTNAPTVVLATNTTTGNFLVVNCIIDGSVTSVTDTQSNTWQKSISSAVNQSVETWYAMNITGGACTITVHLSAAMSGADLVGYEFSGVATSSAVDQTGSGNGTSAIPSSGNITTINANDLLISAVHTAGTINATEAGWTGLITANGNGTEYNIVTATGTYAGTYGSGSAAYDAVISSFKNLSAATVLPSVSVNPSIYAP